MAEQRHKEHIEVYWKEYIGGGQEAGMYGMDDYNKSRKGKCGLNYGECCVPECGA